MRTKASPRTAESQSTAAISAAASGDSPSASQLFDQSNLRKALVAGMTVALTVCLLDIVLPARELVWPTVPLRIVTVFCAFGIALVATFPASLRSRLDMILTAMFFVAGAGTAVIAAHLAASGSPLATLEAVVITFGIYALAGLPIAYSFIAAAPATLVFLVFGSALGVPASGLLHAGFFLLLANVIGLVSCGRRDLHSRDLEERSRELTGLINTDRLTGIYNRHMFDDHIARVWRQSRRERHNLSLLIVDIDYMQMFNRRYGYPEGDRCIRRIGEALKKSVRRPLDFVARYDGSRFALVLYDPPTAYIRKLVVSMQTMITELHIPNESSPIGPRVTVSIGAVVLGPDTAKSLEGAVQFAEEAVAASKLRGRDRAVVFQSSDLERSARSESSALTARA